MPITSNSTIDESKLSKSHINFKHDIKQLFEKVEQLCMEKILEERNELKRFSNPTKNKKSVIINKVKEIILKYEAKKLMHYELCNLIESDENLQLFLKSNVQVDKLKYINDLIESKNIKAERFLNEASKLNGIKDLSNNKLNKEPNKIVVKNKISKPVKNNTGNKSNERTEIIDIKLVNTVNKNEKNLSNSEKAISDAIKNSTLKTKTSGLKENKAKSNNELSNKIKLNSEPSTNKKIGSSVKKQATNNKNGGTTKNNFEKNKSQSKDNTKLAKVLNNEKNTQSQIEPETKNINNATNKINNKIPEESEVKKPNKVEAENDKVIEKNTEINNTVINNKNNKKPIVENKSNTTLKPNEKNQKQIDKNKEDKPIIKLTNEKCLENFKKNINYSNTSITSNVQVYPKLSHNNLYSKYSNRSIASSNIDNKITMNSSRNKMFSLTTLIRSNTNMMIPGVLKISPSQILKFQEIKKTVDLAIVKRKTFIVFNYGIVRPSLATRGWVEKVRINHQSPDILQQANKLEIHQLIHLINDKAHGAIYTRVLKSKILGSHHVDYIWNPPRNIFDFLKNIHKPVHVNIIRKPFNYNFTTKNGLLNNLKRLHWYYKNSIADVYYPRTYNLSDEMEDFIVDFRITACISLLKHFISQVENSTPIVSANGKIPLKSVYFAITECGNYVKFKEDIEYNPPKYSPELWSDFIDDYHDFVYVGEQFLQESQYNILDMSKLAKNTLNKIRPYRTDLMEHEGVLNIWILKPNQQSRGVGIYIQRQMCRIKQIIQSNPNVNYVIQKYIEKPLLLYNTKFDIRQWFLISSLLPFTVWMYKSCYLRFSSQQFNLKRFHESVHLTNNSVQCRYKNGERNSALPNDNMWTSQKFQEYLEENGQRDVWNKIIYPKMKQAITAVVLSAKEFIDVKLNTFELFGADFLLTEDYQPWLIEINSHPALSASTSVTADMCPKVIADVVKVVVDRAKNPHAPVGDFQLIYQDTAEPLPKHSLNDLKILGTPITPHSKLNEL